MKYLLDTYTFLWALSDQEKLPAKARSAIEAPESEVFVSTVSFWEIAIKVRSKRLAPVGKTTSSIVEAAELMGFRPITLSPIEAATQGDLAEDTHFDPFDRMLIWQAISRKMTLVSGDEQLQRFVPDGLKLLWK